MRTLFALILVLGVGFLASGCSCDLCCSTRVPPDPCAPCPPAAAVPAPAAPTVAPAPAPEVPPAPASASQP